MRSRNWSRTLTERSGGNGAVAVFMACYDCFFVQSMPRASKQQARYAVGRCLMLWSSNDVTQQGSRPKTKLDIMSNAVPAEISVQLSLALNAIERHLESTLLAVHLYGSALDGGLKPYSDIDLLVTVAARLDETVRQALVVDLLEISASPGQSEALRALEVTIVVHGDVVPWRYPARRELQFGEWQRKDILAGIFEPATTDVDLAILLTKVRQHSLALAGSAAEDFFNPVPEGDLFKALSDTLKLWNSQPDWEGDERNVVLTLSRIWYSAATGKIAPKDIVANWAMERLPDQHKPVLLEARQAYLGQGEDCLASRADQLAAFVHFVKHEATKLLSAMPVMSNNSYMDSPHKQ